MTNAAQRRIARERRRQRDAKMARAIAPVKAVLKFAFVTMLTVAFGVALIGNIESNIRRFVDMFEVAAVWVFALWLSYLFFMKESK